MEAEELPKESWVRGYISARDLFHFQYPSFHPL